MSTQATEVFTFELSSGHVVLIDEADRELVDRYSWQADCRPQTVYVQGYLIGHWTKHFYLHRVLMDPPPGMQVDHRNGDGLDNRRANLRLATASQNRGNMRLPPRNTSGYKGVSWDKARAKWVARISANGRYRCLGRFDDPWEAAQTYNAAAIEYWGEFAWLNKRIPEGGLS